ncbi:MAG: 50S ribosomal protein L10 [Bacteroidetes bacterium]|nr:50S ribosomal protein L10 [Bacteroidota bacterium]MBS1630607.1 50S ribosomal protein L10 [Bacteroidota bacterium]
MTPAEKSQAIEVLKEKFSQYDNFYVTNTESLSVTQVNTLRRTCFEKGVEMKVAKNTLIRKALESINNEKYSGLYESLNGVTALMFSNSPKDPAVIISDFRGAKGELPSLKAAIIGNDIFTGDKELSKLKAIKSKNELIGEVIGLLMSPISRVISGLQQKAEKETATVE